MTNKIHLIFDYKQETNKHLILFINNITDYAYKSQQFLQISLKLKEIFHKDENIAPENICQVMLNELSQTINEKEIEIKYTVYVSIYQSIIYKHRYPHTKQNDFIAEKIMFLEVEDKTNLQKQDIAEIASIILPAKFKIYKDDKMADSILLNTSDNIFYDSEYINTESYKKQFQLQLDAKNLVQTKFNVKIQNVFCIE